MNHAIAVSRYTFAGQAVQAATNRNMPALTELIGGVGRDVQADRLVLAAPCCHHLTGEVGQPEMVAGVGINLPASGRPVEDADLKIIRRLRNEEVVVKPTDEIGWDLYMAVRQGTTLLGYLLVDDTGSRRQIDRHLERLLRRAAWLFALVLQSRTDHARLEEQAIKDGLTGLPSRGYFDQRSFELEADTRRHGRKLFAIMADADHFKKVNDDNGHGAGDAVLKGIGRIIQECVRENDLPARYGGEEFIIVGEGGADVARTIAERIRSRVMAESPTFYTRSEIVVTISLGIAIFSGERDTLAAAIEHADQALYMAKGAGRNRVEVII